MDALDPPNPITDTELWKLAEAALDALPLNERVRFLSYGEWMKGFQAGLRDAIARLAYFGMSDDEIRTALGVVNR